MAGVDVQRSSARRTRLAVLVAGLLCGLLAGLATAGPASAHATLVSTDPGHGAPGPRPAQPARWPARPIDVELAPAGLGHDVGDAMAVPGAGAWTLTVRIRIDEFTATTASTVVPVR